MLKVNTSLLGTVVFLPYLFGLWGCDWPPWDRKGLGEPVFTLSALKSWAQEAHIYFRFFHPNPLETRPCLFRGVALPCCHACNFYDPLAPVMHAGWENLKLSCLELFHSSIIVLYYFFSNQTWKAYFSLPLCVSASYQHWLLWIAEGFFDDQYHTLLAIVSIAILMLLALVMN